MLRQFGLRFVSLLSLLCLASSTFAGPPQAVDDRLKIELFAEQPTIVTPTGLDVDHRGRVFAIESNTHFRPSNYHGHPSDRVLILEDTDGDHQADRTTVFTDGLSYTMSVAVKPVWLRWRTDIPKVGDENPQPLQVLIATRSTIWLMTDTDGDGKADEKQKLIKLDTPGNYPHNGLAGFAFDAFGWMYFGFGENLGADYKLIGSDNTTLTGGGEGGNIYRCRLDGSKLTHWATGFWNPHASCFDAFGNLITVDNDPDSRPPCRLLHVIEGGDYGFRFRNGRKGLHPFTSWNGEVPGTLPMVGGTGEAPSGILAYESDGLPEDYLGDLLVTSWGDHRIDRFQLQPQGASFTSKAEPMIQGDANFRPVGIALAPDGSLYITDWVKRDYNLHGHGRIWRISAKDEPKRKVIDTAKLHTDFTNTSIRNLISSSRLDVRRIATQLSTRTKGGLSRLRDDVFDSELPRRVRIAAFNHVVSDRSGRDKLLKEIKSNRQHSQSLAHVFYPHLDEHPRQQIPLLYYRLLPFIEEAEGKSNTAGGHKGEMAKNALKIASKDSFLLGLCVGLMRDGYQNLQNRREELLQFGAFDFEPAAPYESLDQFHLAYFLTARTIVPEAASLVKQGLQSEDTDMRRVAVQWAAEEKLQELRPQVEAVLQSKNLTPDLFAATVAALEMLDGKDPKEFDRTGTPSWKYLKEILLDNSRSANLRVTVLRMIATESDKLTPEVLDELLSSDQPTRLRREVARTLQFSQLDKKAERLRLIATSSEEPTQLRADCLLALDMSDTKNLQIAKSLLASDDTVLQQEALASLYDRLGNDREHQQAIRNFLADRIGEDYEAESLIQSVQSGGDVESGRRRFFDSRGAGCFKCHTVHGRGGQVGPDLSVIARTMDRRKLAESILKPSQEIAPQWTPWLVATQTGEVHSGLVLRDSTREIVLGTKDGQQVTIPTNDILERRVSETSIMPEKLVAPLSVAEFRDLIAFLSTLR